MLRRSLLLELVMNFLSDAASRRLTTVSRPFGNSPGTYAVPVPIWETRLQNKANSTEKLNFHANSIYELTAEDEIEAAWREAVELGKGYDPKPVVDIQDPTRVFQTYAPPQVPRSAPIPDDSRYPVGLVEVLFDATAPRASERDPALVVASDFVTTPQLASHLEQDTWIMVPTSQPFHGSELNLQPVSATLPTEDLVSRMLDSNSSQDDDSETRETNVDYVPNRQGRSLTRALSFEGPTTQTFQSINPTCNQEAHGVQNLSFQSNISADDDDQKDEFGGMDVEYQEVLRRITAYNFLPGQERLTEVTARPTFVQYDHDLYELYQASVAFLGDHVDNECICLNQNPSDAVMPGENFFASNAAAYGISMERPNSQSILHLIDELATTEMFLDDEVHEVNEVNEVDESDEIRIFEAIDKYAASELVFENDLTDSTVGFDVLSEISCDSCQPADGFSFVQPGAFHDTDTEQTSQYKALDELLHASAKVGALNIGQLATDPMYQGSDMSCNVGDDMSTCLPSDLTYYDASSQQYIVYTAFNQLLKPNEYETPPHMYRAYDDDHFDEDTDISKSTPDGTLPPTSPLRIVNGIALADLDFEFARSSNPMVERAPLRRSSFTRLRRFKTMTLLETIYEEVEEQESSLSVTSDDSLDFADHRGIVDPLSVRRVDFLDDEEDSSQGAEDVEDGGYNDKGMTEYYEDDSLDESGIFRREPSYSHVTAPSTSPLSVSVHVSVHSFFDDDVWHVEPDITLGIPNHDTQNAMLTPDLLFPEPNLLEYLEIKIYGVLTSIFDHLNNNTFQELSSLSSDLHSALAALAAEFPSMSIAEGLGVALEILVERMAVSSTH